MKKILITGAAGFIGYHLIKSLLHTDYEILGLDIINSYYDVELKYARLYNLGIKKNLINYNTPIKSSLNEKFTFVKLDLCDTVNLSKYFSEHKVDIVINLAAQAGVRYSITNPNLYIDSNVIGFFNLIENCRNHNIKHFIYASSSSVYGLNKKMPLSVKDNVDHPISLYAATKKSNELIAHSYSHLFGLPTTGLRFFTVYGPWGRPDMAYFSFTKDIFDGKPIRVFNNGKMERDFTFITDIIDGINDLLEYPQYKKQSHYSNTKSVFSNSSTPYRILNLGNNKPVQLLKFIQEIEKNIGIKAKIELCPLQPGDVVKTWADISETRREINFNPKTNFEFGIAKFVEWFKEYYT